MLDRALGNLPQSWYHVVIPCQVGASAGVHGHSSSTHPGNQPMEEKAALEACRGGTAKCLEMQLQTALWGEKHSQPRTETPSSAEREIGNEKHAQCKKTQKPDAYLRLPVQAACVHLRVSFHCLWRLELCVRVSHSAFAMAEPGTPQLGVPSPGQPTASVSTSDSNSLRRSVERLFKRSMAAEKDGDSTSTASAATGNTCNSPSKQFVVSAKAAPSPGLRRETTARPLPERELAPSLFQEDELRWKKDENATISTQQRHEPSSCFDVPANKRFCGRQDIIQQLSKHLMGPEGKPRPGGLALLYGLGGMGKSAIDVKFVYDQGQHDCDEPTTRSHWSPS